MAIENCHEDVVVSETLGALMLGEGWHQGNTGVTVSSRGK